MNSTLRGHAHFVQELLKGLNGNSTILTRQETTYLFNARPLFSLGWFQGTDELDRPYYYHSGNPGTFLSKVYIYPWANRAIVMFTNIQSQQAENGLDRLRERLEQQYLAKAKR